MAKKLRVKDMKTDAFRVNVVATMERVLEFLRAHRVALLAAVGGVAVVVVGAIGISTYLAHREAAAQVALGAALDDLEKAEQGVTGPDATAGAEPAPPSLDAVREHLAEVASEYPGTEAGVLAAHYLGIADLRAGGTKEAVVALSRFVGEEKDHWATPHALAALATAQEDSGDTAAAEASLRRLADGKWRSYPRAAALMRLAAYLERHAQPEKAREIYTQLSTDSEFAESVYSSQARGRLETLGTAAASG